MKSFRTKRTRTTVGRRRMTSPAGILIENFARHRRHTVSCFPVAREVNMQETLTTRDNNCSEVKLALHTEWKRMVEYNAVVLSYVDSNVRIQASCCWQAGLNSVALRAENDGCSDWYQDSYSIVLHEQCLTQITVRGIAKNTTQSEHFWRPHSQEKEKGRSISDKNQTEVDTSILAGKERTKFPPKVCSVRKGRWVIEKKAR